MILRKFIAKRAAQNHPNEIRRIVTEYLAGDIDDKQLLLRLEEVYENEANETTADTFASAFLEAATKRESL